MRVYSISEQIELAMTNIKGHIEDDAELIMMKEGNEEKKRLEFKEVITT